MSVALLLSSAGLAASLLAGAVAQESQLARAAWQPLLALPRAASELPTPPPTYAQAMPVSFSSVAPAYSFAASTAYGALPAEVAAGPDASAAPETSSLKATVQRSWHTFKLAFR